MEARFVLKELPIKLPNLKIQLRVNFYLVKENRDTLKKKEVDENRIIKLSGADGHNLKSVNLELPLDLFVCVTGVSGSGKSTLINQTLLPGISNEISRAEKEMPKYLKNYLE